MPDYRVSVTVTFDLDVSVGEPTTIPEYTAQQRAKSITKDVFKENFSRAACVSVNTIGATREL